MFLHLSYCCTGGGRFRVDQFGALLSESEEVDKLYKIVFGVNSKKTYCDSLRR